MEQIEDVVALVGVFAVEHLDALARDAQQAIVFGHRFRRGIREIGQQREMQMLVTIGEVSNFQRLEQTDDLLFAAQHRRHDDRGAIIRRDAERKIHTRQLARRDDQRA